MSFAFFDSPRIFASNKIPDDAQIVFVSDMFSLDFQGGAELTTDALIKHSPFKVFRLRSKDVTLDLLREGQKKFWIFGNYSNMDLKLIPSIVANMNYSIIEYDYKYCRYRSPEKHGVIEGQPCDCQNQPNGKMVSAFMYGARSLWWMSEAQRDWYHSIFPFLEDKPNTVLSSVFDDWTFTTIKLLRSKYKNAKRQGWVVLDSPSWVKGADAAKQWCREHNKKMIPLWGVPYVEVLEKLAQAEGFVYLPAGKDTCPRMVIEARLLGCQLCLNDNVQHKDEIWFDTDDLLETESYLYMARQRFWNGIKADMNYSPQISGYTTTLNCVRHGYPFQQSIKSMLGFCDEVVVVDGGSDDGTWEILKSMAAADDRLVIHQEVRDWSHKRFAVFDGEQKAKARSLCTKEFCWQQDADEVVHEKDYAKIKKLLMEFPPNVQLICLPVVEYWGGPSKVRMDIFPWKWRLSRNYPNITHGIPKSLRKFDSEGNLYAGLGTDGCDYIDANTYEPIPNVSFYTYDVHILRLRGMEDEDARRAYEKWFNEMVDKLPSVHHYSWFDLKRKIRTYRDYWSRHWQSLYNISQEDTAENNMFFQKPWSEVTEEDIDKLATRLESEMGGWIFHTPVDFSKPTPHIRVKITHPAIMNVYMTEEIRQLSLHLLDLKRDGDWQSVRTLDGIYKLTEVDYPFGKRCVYQLIDDQQKYVDLQQSRGVPVEATDSPDDILQRAICSIDELQESDIVRIEELCKLLNDRQVKIVGFAELGFRIPKLQKYYYDRGARITLGYDVADLSLAIGRRLGYNVHRYDFNQPSKPLDLKGCNVVVSYHMLEHVSDPLQAVDLIAKSMEPGAYFHVEVPIEPDGPRIRYAHLFPFHSGDLAEMLKIAKLEILHESTKTHRDGPAIERILAMKPVKG